LTAVYQAKLKIVKTMPNLFGKTTF